MQFSIVELLNQFKADNRTMLFGRNDLQLGEVEEALLYLSKIGALKLEGGFLVLYNAMDIRRIKDNKSRYKVDDYRLLNAFYKQKIQQVHIVGRVCQSDGQGLQRGAAFVQDYFQMDYRRFIAKYFRGERINEIQRNLTPQKYEQLFGRSLLDRWRSSPTRNPTASWLRPDPAAARLVCWSTNWHRCSCSKMSSTNSC